MESIAARFLEEGPARPMIDAMENLSDRVLELSPVEFGDLRDSGHPVVVDDGEVVYDRPPVAHRLSKEELAAKAELRETGVRISRRKGVLGRSITAHHEDDEFQQLLYGPSKGKRKDAALKRARREAFRTGSALTPAEQKARSRNRSKLTTRERLAEFRRNQPPP